MGAIDNFFNKIRWNISKYFIVPLLGFLIFYILMDEILMPAYTRHGQAIEVPNIVEMTYEGARTLLQQQGFKIVEKEKKFDVRYRAGTVISQNPLSQARVKKGRRVYVIVSKGEPTVEMPRLIGKSEKNAIFEINRLGIEVRHITLEHSSHFPDGVVIDQSIPYKEEAKIGESIDLIVSLGQFPDRFIVPNLIGRSLDDAKRVIQQAGLTLGIVNFKVEDELLPETVIDQSLEANSEVTQGDSLSLIISKLAETTEDIPE